MSKSHRRTEWQRMARLLQVNITVPTLHELELILLNPIHAVDASWRKSCLFTRENIAFDEKTYEKNTFDFALPTTYFFEGRSRTRVSICTFVKESILYLVLALSSVFESSPSV